MEKDTDTVMINAGFNYTSYIEESYIIRETGEELDGIAILISGVLKKFVDKVKKKDPKKYTDNLAVVRDAMMKGLISIDPSNAKMASELKFRIKSYHLQKKNIDVESITVFILGDLIEVLDCYKNKHPKCESNLDAIIDIFIKGVGIIKSDLFVFYF